MKLSTNSTNTVLYLKLKKRNYPDARIIVSDDNLNTLKHVAK